VIHPSLQQVRGECIEKAPQVRKGQDPSDAWRHAERTNTNASLLKGFGEGLTI
jgi:hypothetical protein